MEKSNRLRDSNVYVQMDNFFKALRTTPELWTIFSSTHEAFERIVESPLKIAVMGEFNAGKSSFVNSLLGQAKLLPVGLIPKTATINELTFGEKPQTTICYKDNTRATHDGYGILEDYNQASKQDNVAFSRELERVERIIVAVNADYLQLFTIIDTPGFNQADAEALDETSFSILNEVDWVIWLFNAGQAGTLSECSYLKKIKASVQNIYAVFNRIDEVEVEPASLCCNLKEHFNGIFINEDVLGICADTEKRKTRTDLSQGFNQLISDLQHRIFNEDYRLSLDRLRELNTTVHSMATEYTDYLGRASKDMEKALAAFRDKVLTSTDNQSNEYAMVLKENANKLTKGFVEEISKNIVACSKEKLLAYLTKPPVSIGINSPIKEYFCLLRGMQALTAACNQHERECMSNIAFFEQSLSALLMTLQDNIKLQPSFFSQQEHNKYSRKIDIIRTMINKKKDEWEPNTAIGYFTGLVFNGFFLGLLETSSVIRNNKNPSRIREFFGAKYDDENWLQDVSSVIWQKLDQYLIERLYVSHFKMKTVSNMAGEITESQLVIYRRKLEILNIALENIDR
jgi:GTPase Era involved in 16S rRNA processing